jgi:hypothetical protein
MFISHFVRSRTAILLHSCLVPSASLIFSIFHFRLYFVSTSYNKMTRKLILSGIIRHKPSAFKAVYQSFLTRNLDKYARINKDVYTDHESGRNVDYIRIWPFENWPSSNGRIKLQLLPHRESRIHNEDQSLNIFQGNSLRAVRNTSIYCVAKCRIHVTAAGTSSWYCVLFG